MLLPGSWGPAPFCPVGRGFVQTLTNFYFFWQWKNDQQYHLITVFFPFLFRDLNDGWGLPHSCFSPREFYKKCARQASRIIFFHQGEYEMQCSKAMIESLISASGRGCIVYQGRVHENVYVKRQHPVYSLIWQS